MFHSFIKPPLRGLGIALLALLTTATQAEDHTQYVNPFIGTQADNTGSLAGSTFPGPTMPLGMVQLSPDTELQPTWDPCSGYDYNKDRIYGFSHTHLSGTGCTDLFDVNVMPVTCPITQKYLSQADYSATFNHKEEGATPGYYWVKLQDSGVKAELTATTRAGIHRYTFPRGADQHIIIDLDHSTYRGNDTYYIQKRGYNILQSQIRIIDSQTIEGYRVITGWAKLRKVYFRARFSRPFTATLMNDGGRTVEDGKIVNGRRLHAAFTFDKAAGQDVTVCIAISPVSSEGARGNFKAECPHFDFEAYRQAAHDAWEKELARIDIDGTEEQKTIFYTGLYHVFIQPNTMSDADGHYLNTNYEEATLPHGERYFSTFSLWDTFRAAHPLINLIAPDYARDFIDAMLRHADTYGYLPIWDLWGQDNYCMIGNHAQPVLSRAILTGIYPDAAKAYKAMRQSATLSHRSSPFETWEKLGYIPENRLIHSVSITMEQAFDDWCVAAVAQKLGHAEDHDRFLARSENYRNLFNPAIGFFAPRDDKGQWMTPFDPLDYEGRDGCHPFIEGNAWQYMWFVPQNPQGLISLFGGRDGFVKKLDENFTLVTGTSDHEGNASAFIGQYAHGNEPSHHTAYLYNFAGQPWKTQRLVNQVRSEFYNASPMGYAGNDDCGQMSAWYIFSSLGFYPFNAGSDDFVIGTPLFPRAVIHLPGGHDLTVTARNLSPTNIFVKSVRLNGKRLPTLSFTQQQVMQGGTLEFEMTARRPK